MVCVRCASCSCRVIAPFFREGMPQSSPRSRCSARAPSTTDGFDTIALLFTSTHSLEAVRTRDGSILIAGDGAIRVVTRAGKKALHFRFTLPRVVATQIVRTEANFVLGTARSLKTSIVSVLFSARSCSPRCTRRTAFADRGSSGIVCLSAITRTTPLEPCNHHYNDESKTKR